MTTSVALLVAATVVGFPALRPTFEQPPAVVYGVARGERVYVLECAGESRVTYAIVGRDGGSGRHQELIRLPMPFGTPDCAGYPHVYHAEDARLVTRWRWGPDGAYVSYGGSEGPRGPFTVDDSWNLAWFPDKYLEGDPPPQPFSVIGLVVPDARFLADPEASLALPLSRVPIPVKNRADWMMSGTGFCGPIKRLRIRLQSIYGSLREIDHDVRFPTEVMPWGADRVLLASPVSLAPRSPDSKPDVSADGWLVETRIEPPPEPFPPGTPAQMFIEDLQFRIVDWLVPHRNPQRPGNDLFRGWQCRATPYGVAEVPGRSWLHAAKSDAGLRLTFVTELGQVWEAADRALRPAPLDDPFRPVAVRRVEGIDPVRCLVWQVESRRTLAFTDTEWFDLDDPQRRYPHRARVRADSTAEDQLDLLARCVRLAGLDREGPGP